MKIRLFITFLFTISANVVAENCWLSGCKDRLGYIRYIKVEGKVYMPFKTESVPAVGSQATLCANAFLRTYNFAKHIDKEVNDGSISGNLLGKGSVIKILDHAVTKEGEMMVVARVISDNYSLPISCGKPEYLSNY